MANRCRGGRIGPPRERSERARQNYFAVRIKNQRFVSGHGFTGRGKTRFGSRRPTSGAKARPILKDLATRLKSCPFQNLLEAEFFSSLFSDAANTAILWDPPAEARTREEA